MTALAKLKLVSVTAEKKTPTLLRRNKLTAHLDDQIALAKAVSVGEIYAAKRQKFFTDKDTGVRTQVELSRRVKQWWFTAPNGKMVIALRYGAKPIEIAKGKNAIEVNNMDDLLATLAVIKEAVQFGELDAQMEQASGSLRTGFSTKK